MKKWSRLLLVVGIIILSNFSAFAKIAHPFETCLTATRIKKMIDQEAWYGVKSASGREHLHHAVAGTSEPIIKIIEGLGNGLALVKSNCDEAWMIGTNGVNARIRSLLLRSESLVRRGKLLKTTHYQKN